MRRTKDAGGRIAFSWHRLGRHSSLVDWRPRDLGPEHWRSPSLSVTGRGSYPALVATPQTGIFALGTMSHAYLELDGRPGVDPRDLIAAVATLREPRTTIGGVNLVTGFRPELWASVGPDVAPVGLRGFNEPLVGRDGYTMPATQHDVVVWLSGAAYDVVFDVSRGIVSALAGQATLALEIVGWPYHRDRDLTGFEDGLENPTLAEASREVSIDPGSPGEGGSVLLLQQWEHDSARWEALPIDEQERAMGRTKLTGVELDPRPETSHVGSTDQDRFGKIFRRNIGYGSLGRHGTIFVGFSRDRDRLEAMLESMAGIGGGQRDQLTRFTQPLTGAYYFVPSSEALAAFAASA
jgi:porphyrinogen peroxidase